MLLLAVYIGLCFVVGLAGRRRRIGFAGYMLLALFLTPFLPLFYLFLTQKRFLQLEAAERMYPSYRRSHHGRMGSTESDG